MAEHTFDRGGADDGTLMVSIFRSYGEDYVQTDVNPPATGFGLTADQARAYAADLLAHADALDPPKPRPTVKVTVPADWDTDSVARFADALAAEFGRTFFTIEREAPAGIADDDVFLPGHTYRSANGYFEFRCEQRLADISIGIETTLKDHYVPAGARHRKWFSIGPSVGYDDVTNEVSSG